MRCSIAVTLGSLVLAAAPAFADPPDQRVVVYDSNYAYTEEGDHMGFHYDTSYYKDRRWTLLVGFKDDSSSRLLCHLHTKQPGHAVEKLELKMTPGMLVLFNGDKVYHSVSPVKAGETRYVISMQFVTSGEMNPFMRFISNMKDAVAYFGLRGVFTAGKRTS